MEGSALAEEVTQFREGLDSRTNALLDDFDCLRFLRARQMDVSKAVEMAAAWGIWMEEVLPGTETSPINILDQIEDPNEALYNEMCPHAMIGEDKEGRPIYWEKTGEGSQRFYELKQQVNYDQLIARHVRLQQLMSCRLKFCSDKHGKKIDKMIIVDDFSNISMQPDLDSIKFAIGVLKIDQNYFPETLHTLYAINCPWYFTALYALVSPFMDSVTKAKMRILGYDYRDTLLEAIDENQIPTEYGGTLEAKWKWPYAEESGCSPEHIANYRYDAAKTVSAHEFIEVEEDQKHLEDVS